MNEENEKKLNSIFSAFKAENEKSLKEKELKTNIEDKFVNDFKKLVKNVIEPKMEDFKMKLEQNEFAAKITYFDGDESGRGNSIYPRIQMQISKNKDSKFTDTRLPHIEFVGNKMYQKIGIHESTITLNGGGTSGMRGNAYAINELDEKVIEKEILESIQNILIN